MKQRNGGASQDIMMNLLGESSDSGPELLNLPPLKGKKHKKKKNPYGLSGEITLCNLWTFFKIFFFILLIASVTVMAVVSFWLSNQVSDLKQKLQLTCSTCANVFGIFLLGACVLTCIALLWTFFQMKKDLDEMRNKMSTVESKNQGSLESYQDLHGQIQAINRSLQSLKTGGDVTTEQLFKNLKEMSLKITALNITTETLKEGLKAAPELKQISNKVPVISKSVASLGVDVKTIQTTVKELEQFRKTTEKQMQQFVIRTKMTSPTPGSNSHPVNNPDLEDNAQQRLNSVSQMLSHMNSSVWTQLGALQQELGIHQTRFVILENVTHVLQSKIDKLSNDHAAVLEPNSGREHGTLNDDTKQLETQVKSMVQHIIQDMDLQNRTEKDSSALDSLLDNMDNVTSIVKTLKKQFQEVIQDHSKLTSDANSSSSPEQLQNLEHRVTGRVQVLENTVHSMQRELQATVTHLTSYTKKVSDLTALVDGIKRYIAVKEKENLKSEDQKETAQNTTETIDMEHSTVPSTVRPSTKVNTSGTENTTSLVGSITQAPSAATEATTRPHLTFADIKTLADLEKNFSSWDRKGNGLIDPDILQDYMAHPPSKEELKPYDQNNDGLYSIEELANALGLIKPDETNSAGNV